MSNNTRYEVVAPMPHFTHLFKGDILVPKQHALCDLCWGAEDEDNPHRWVTFCPDYPHLFRLLKWWEGLAVDELPKYVKWECDKDIYFYKVGMWLLEPPQMPFDDGTLFLYNYDEDTEQFAYNYDGEIYPATEAEYNEYLTKLKGK